MSGSRRVDFYSNEALDSVRYNVCTITGSLNKHIGGLTVVPRIAPSYDAVGVLIFLKKKECWFRSKFCVFRPHVIPILNSSFGRTQMILSRMLRRPTSCRARSAPAS